jgi:hypothetical protein
VGRLIDAPSPATGQRTQSRWSDCEVVSNLCFAYLVIFFFQFLGVGSAWVHLVRRPLFGLLYQPRMIDDECAVLGGMRIGRGNRNTRRKRVPMTLCAPQIPYDLNWNATRARRGGKPATNGLSYGTASASLTLITNTRFRNAERTVYCHCAACTL